MKNIPEKQLKTLFQNIASFYKGSYHPERIYIKVVSGATKDQQREIANVVSQYYAGWYKDYGGVGSGTNYEFYVVFYNKEHCRLAFDDLTEQHRKYMESDAYTGVPAASSDTADYTNAEGAEPEDDDEETDTQAKGPLAVLMQNKSLLIVGAVLIAAVVLVLVFVKD